MARRLRQAATSDWHHVMNRGARWLPIFGDDSDRTLFLSLLRDVRRRSTVEIHAYALMRNHFHLLLHADQPSMSDALKYVLGTYTQRFNHKYGLDGPLYRSRFRSVPIETERHLLAEVRYIHRNPVQGRAAPTLSDYRWTSHLAYAGLATAPAWLITTAIATRFSSVDDYRRFVETGPEPLSTSEISAGRPVRVLRPQDIEAALGVSSPNERALLRVGGRGIRNDLRTACIFLCRELSAASAEELAIRYGLTSANAVRAVAARAAARCEDDAEFATIVGAARGRMSRVAA